MLYFWKANGPGHQKWYSGLSNTQIHKYKYANTQIQHVRKCRKYPHTYIFETPTIPGHQKWYSGLSNTQMHKYKDTNTKIQPPINLVKKAAPENYEILSFFLPLGLSACDCLFDPRNCFWHLWYWASTINGICQKGPLQFIGSLGHYFTPGFVTTIFTEN